MIAHVIVAGLTGFAAGMLTYRAGVPGTAAIWAFGLAFSFAAIGFQIVEELRDIRDLLHDL